MFKTLKYQQDAINDLLRHTYSVLRNYDLNDRTKIQLKAPTGAGKTVIMEQYLKRLGEDLPHEEDLPHRRFAFIWIAPNQLHEQSYRRLNRFFSENRTLTCKLADGFTDRQLLPNELLFVNWQSISGINRVLLTPNESGKYLGNILENTRRAGVELIVILDEAHLFASTGEKASETLKLIRAAIEIDVSATPLFDNAEYKVTIPRQAVVKAEMIKKTAKLNDNLDPDKQDDKLTIYLLNQALAKREHLARLYAEAGSAVRPLLLIQLPSDGEAESALDKKVKDVVLHQLEHDKGITYQNGRLAIWLSKEKRNLRPGDPKSVVTRPVEASDSEVDVLIFKQGISLGWDCPRASVLLIYRDIKQFSFTVQTIGRIMRMPEQQHYVQDELNYGYIYTNLNRGMLKIVKDEMEYDGQYQAKRRADYVPLHLHSTVLEAVPVRTDALRTSYYDDFERVLREQYGLVLGLQAGGALAADLNKATLQKRLFDFTRQAIDVSVLVNAEVVDDEGLTVTGQTRKFLSYADEVSEELDKFCDELCGTQFYRRDSRGIIRKALMEILCEEHLGIFLDKAPAFLLQNREAVTDLVNTALQEYVRQVQAKKGLKPEPKAVVWEVPEKLSFTERYEAYPALGAVMEPLYLQKRDGGLFAASDPEQKFIELLESSRGQASVTWWYKNGDRGKEHFSVSYVDTKGNPALFYVDFLIQFKNGTLGFFDTKTVGSAAEAVPKHNALVGYLENLQASGKAAIGGILIQDNQSWLYCENRLENDHDHTGWTVLDITRFV